MNNVPYKFAGVWQWRRFYIDFLYYCDHLMGVACWDFVEVQVVVVQLSDSDSSTEKKSVAAVKSLHTNRQ
jgi:hypothetical protein